jgi:hypothetical protein
MVKRAPVNVRYLWLFGEHILTRSFTARDPKPTSCAVRGGLLGGTGRFSGDSLCGRRQSHLTNSYHRPAQTRVENGHHLFSALG